MSNLSPAAQAVLDAVENHGKFSYRKLAAAALRAAIKVVEDDEIEFMALSAFHQIADELEGDNA